MGATAAVEPRIACPACGGQVHPIAGRCKHCRADLSQGRPAAMLGRPPLMALGGGAPPPPPAFASGNGHPAPAHASHPAAMLPSTAAPATSSASWSSRWPLIVALLAILAIIASVALLMFGGGSGKKKDSGAKRFDGPAPELMPTDPLSPRVTPPAPPPNGAPHANGTTPTDPRSPFDNPALPPPPPPRAGAGPATAHEFFSQAVDGACRRMTTCAANDPTVASYCTMAHQMLPQMTDSIATMCTDYDGAAGQQCLDAVARFPCPSGAIDTNAMAATLMGLSGCQQVCASAFAGMGGMLDITP